MLDHVVMAGCFLPLWFLGQVGLLQRTEASGEMVVIIVAALSQSTMRILCPYFNWLLSTSRTVRFKNLYQAVRVDCHAGMEQDYGIFGLIWKFEKTSEIILEYAQQTAW